MLLKKDLSYFLRFLTHFSILGIARITLSTIVISALFAVLDKGFRSIAIIVLPILRA